MEAIADFHGRFLSEIGNNNITGQQGLIPFILRKSGDITIKVDKHIGKRKLSKILFFLIIIFQNLNPIYGFR